MKFLATLLLLNLTLTFAQGQNYKALQISEMKIRQFNGPSPVLLDSDGNSFFVNWTGNGQIISDTIYVYKLSNSGKHQKTLKINSLYGGLSNTAFQRLSKEKFILAISFTDSILIQNQVYKVRYNENNQLGVQGSALVVFNTQLEILEHKFIGFGVNKLITSISALANRDLLLGIHFTDTLDTRPCGGDLFVVPEPDTIVGEHLNIAFLELDSSLNFKIIVRSKSIGTIQIIPNSGSVVSQKISSIVYTREDTVRMGNNLFGPELNYTPLLFKLGNNQEISWFLKGTNSPGSTTNDTGFITSILEDSTKNFIAIIHNYGLYNLGTVEIGKPNDLSTSLVRFDSLGNILWAKTIGTYGGRAYQSDLSMNPLRNRFLFVGALQDTFTLGNYNFSTPSNDTKKGFIAEFDLDGNVQNVQILGFDQPNYSIDFMAANMDSVGNTYALFTTQSIGAFTTDCFTLPTLTSLQEDSSRLVWLKFGPSTLKKDSLVSGWDRCTSLGRIAAHYQTQYSNLQYQLNGQPIDSLININQAGNYQLIVKDATCYADTHYFSFPPQTMLSQPTILGNTNAGTAFVETYQIEVLDSVVIQWTVTGGFVVIGQGTDSITVAWQNPGLGELIVQVSDSAATCFRTDTLHVTITALSKLLASRTWHVSPNPATSQIRIQGTEPGSVHYNLTDLTGKVCLYGSSTEPDLTISIGGLSKGVYILLIQSASGLQTTTKLIIE